MNFRAAVQQQPLYVGFVFSVNCFSSFLGWGGHQGSRLLQIAALKVKLAAKSPKTFSLLLLD